MNVFYLESFIDELAHAAGKDSYEYRRELVARNTKFRDRDDWLKALDMVAEMSGWGKPLPEGWARGIAVDDRRRALQTRTATTLCAEVVTVSVSRSGQLRLERVDVVFDEGFSLVNPLSVRKQIEGRSPGTRRCDVAEITIKDGRVVEATSTRTGLPAWRTIRRRSSSFKTNKRIGREEEACRRSRPPWPRRFSVTGKRSGRRCSGSGPQLGVGSRRWITPPAAAQIVDPHRQRRG